MKTTSEAPRGLSTEAPNRGSSIVILVSQIEVIYWRLANSKLASLSSYYHEHRTQETYFLPAFYLLVIITLPLYYIRRLCLTYSIPPVALQATIANIGTGRPRARDYRPYTPPCTYLAISSYYSFFEELVAPLLLANRYSLYKCIQVI
jgi:hypothetical protein